MTICTDFDEFMSHYAENCPRWEVVLSNDQRVFMDDDRPDMEPRSAWLRLREHCKKEHLYIKEMTIMFRDNRFSLPSNADGYFFSKGARGMFGSVRTMHLFLVGALQNGRLEVSCWKVPEMLQEWTEERNPDEAGECLISKDDMLLSMEQPDPSCPTNTW